MILITDPTPAPPLGIPKGDACYPLELVRLPEQERDARRGGVGVGALTIRSTSEIKIY